MFMNSADAAIETLKTKSYYCFTNEVIQKSFVRSELGKASNSHFLDFKR